MKQNGNMTYHVKKLKSQHTEKNKMIGKAYTEGSKSNVTMNAWLPQASSGILWLTVKHSMTC
jgi:hypothetical protein